MDAELVSCVALAIAPPLSPVTGETEFSAVTESGVVVEVGLTAIAPELLSVTTAESEVLGVADTIAPASPVTLDGDSVVTTDCCGDTGVVDPESSGAIA
jgi:hypothetical protein